MSDFTSKLHSLINLLSIPAISNAQVCAVDVFDNDKFKCWQNSGNPLNEIVDLSSSSTVAQWYCQYCKKKFSSLATFQHHERSKKHLQVVGKLSITHKSLSKTPMSPPASTKLDNSQGLLELELKVNETLKIASQNPTLSAIVLWDAAQSVFFLFPFLEYFKFDLFSP
ncbi:hypothetical protein HMI55_002465 [Coelomomyces lativittatus]|nr:hypothetical protein HMI55_002465 [Coelomomyces lativittatus]